MIRNRSPDFAKANSMLTAVVEDMTFLETIITSPKAKQTLIRGIYENFRLLGEALLTAKGLEATGTDHHAEMIAALIHLNVKTTRPLETLHILRKLRHAINYEGYIPTAQDVADTLSIKNDLWQPLLTDVKRTIEEKK